MGSVRVLYPVNLLLLMRCLQMAPPLCLLWLLGFELLARCCAAQTHPSWLPEVCIFSRNGYGFLPLLEQLSKATRLGRGTVRLTGRVDDLGPWVVGQCGNSASDWTLCLLQPPSSGRARD